jgi:hypothetical protein
MDSARIYISGTKFGFYLFDWLVALGVGVPIKQLLDNNIKKNKEWGKALQLFFVTHQNPDTIPSLTNIFMG